MLPSVAQALLRRCHEIITRQAGLPLRLPDVRLVLLFVLTLALQFSAVDAFLEGPTLLRDLALILATAAVIGVSAHWGRASAGAPAEVDWPERLAGEFWNDPSTGWLLLDRQARVFDANPFALACLSLTRRGAVGSQLGEVLPFGIGPVGRELLSRLSIGAEPLCLQAIRVVSSTHGVRHLDLRCEWLQAEQLFLVRLDDVTLRVEAQQARSQGDALLKHCLSLAQHGFCVLQDGRVQHCNEAFAGLLGLPPAQLHGVRLESLLLPRVLSPSRLQIQSLLGGQDSERLLQLRVPPHAAMDTLESALPNEETRTVRLRVAVVQAPGRLLLSSEDLTDLQRDQASLRLARLVFDHIQEGLVVTDSQGCISAANPAFCNLLGRPRESMLGTSMPDLLKQAGGAEPAVERWRDLIESTGCQDEAQVDVVLQTVDGRSLTLWMSCSLARQLSGEVSHVVATCIDVTERRRDRRRLEELACRDELTGLANRARLSEQLSDALKESRGQDQAHHGAVLLIDLDRFKTVNDSMGHPAGDRLLQQVARRLQGVLRQGDLLGRWGGDEFVLLLQGLHDAEEAAEVAARLVQSLDEPFLLDADGTLPTEREVYIGASIGITLYPQAAVDVHGLLQQADAAMYQAKALGRGRYAFFSPQLTEAARRRLENETRLRGALQAGQFEVHYQPLVRSSDAGPCGVEALIRWRDPQRGLIAPAEFIPLAEETGLILSIGAWVIETVCAQLAVWRAAGIEPGYAAINLSSLQFSHPSLCQTVEAALLRFNLPAQLLELEITEGHLLDAELAVQRLNRLKDLGVRIAIDDFGTGYSSLSYIGRFRFDKLKIDRSFIRGVPGDATAVAIVQTIVTLARALHVEVLAEGVETEAQFGFVREQGIDCAQGWLFAPALSVQDVEPALRGDRLPANGLMHWRPQRPAADAVANPGAASRTGMETAGESVSLPV